MKLIKLKAQPSLLLFICFLGFLLFQYPNQKQIPPGADSVVYLNDLNWTIDHEQLPESNQNTYFQINAYPAPITNIILSAQRVFHTDDVNFVVFLTYQSFLIILLLISAYLVGTIYSPRLSILFPLTLLASFPIIRIYIASSLANLLAFSILNLIFYSLYTFNRKKVIRGSIVLLILFIALFFVHNYLTAPLFFAFIFFFLIYIFFADKNLRYNTLLLFRRLGNKTKFFSLITLLSLFSVLILRYIPIIRQGVSAFVSTGIENKFIFPLTVNLWPEYLGLFVFFFAIPGSFFYIRKDKKNILTYKSLPLFWVLFILLLLQSYRLGLDFYYERIIFLAGPFIAFFSAFFINEILEFVQNRRFVYQTIFLLYIVVIIFSGSQQITTLFDNSNKVSTSQIQTLEFLKEVSGKDSIVYSNINAVAGTKHDLIISDRKIIHYNITKTDCTSIGCNAFNYPSDEASKTFYQENEVSLFLFLYPGRESVQNTKQLELQYTLDPDYVLLRKTDDSRLFQLSPPN